VERWPTWRRDAGGLAGIALLGWLGMRGHRVPLLGGVDLGFHELGHMVCYILDAFLPWPEVVTAAAGSGFQIGVPLGLAVYFLVFRYDRTGGALCLAWAATDALDVARYMADAPFQAMPLIGGQHDWAYILGPEQLDRLGQAGHDAARLTGFAWVLFAASIGVALLPALRWLFTDGRGPAGTAALDPADSSSLRFPV
jgi:hypothetical protein